MTTHHDVPGTPDRMVLGCLDATTTRVLELECCCTRRDGAVFEASARARIATQVLGRYSVTGDSALSSRSWAVEMVSPGSVAEAMSSPNGTIADPA